MYISLTSDQNSWVLHCIKMFFISSRKIFIIFIPTSRKITLSTPTRMPLYDFLLTLDAEGWACLYMMSEQFSNALCNYTELLLSEGGYNPDLTSLHPDKVLNETLTPEQKTLLRKAGVSLVKEDCINLETLSKEVKEFSLLGTSAGSNVKGNVLAIKTLITIYK